MAFVVNVGELVLPASGRRPVENLPFDQLGPRIRREHPGLSHSIVGLHRDAVLQFRKFFQQAIDFFLPTAIRFVC